MATKHLDIADAIKYNLKKASKQRNATMYLYYTQIQNNPNILAFSSFEIFKGSWAYHQWYNKHQNDITDIIENNARRFGEVWRAE
jgi:hypothetical protein